MQRLTTAKVPCLFPASRGEGQPPPSTSIFCYWPSSQVFTRNTVVLPYSLRQSSPLPNGSKFPTTCPAGHGQELSTLTWKSVLQPQMTGCSSSTSSAPKPSMHLADASLVLLSVKSFTRAPPLTPCHVGLLASLGYLKLNKGMLPPSNVPKPH